MINIRNQNFQRIQATGTHQPTETPEGTPRDQQSLKPDISSAQSPKTLPSKGFSLDEINQLLGSVSPSFKTENGTVSLEDLQAYEDKLRSMLKNFGMTKSSEAILHQLDLLALVEKNYDLIEALDGQPGISPEDIAKADVNGDGTLDEADIRSLQGKENPGRSNSSTPTDGDAASPQGNPGSHDADAILGAIQRYQAKNPPGGKSNKPTGVKKFTPIKPGTVTKGKIDGNAVLDQSP